MLAYLARVHTALHDFNELLPPPTASIATEAKTELKNCTKLFMTLALYGLPQEYSATRDQILGSPMAPTMQSASATLLRISLEPTVDVPESTIGDSSALVSQSNKFGRSGTRPSKPKDRFWCTHCHQDNHSTDWCCKLCGKPSHLTNVAQTSPNDST